MIEFIEGRTASWPEARELAETFVRIVPAERPDECIHVTTGLGTEVDMIGMLVHIERDDRGPAGDSVAMVGCPLVDELAVAGRL
jgi:hypothetical protein